MITRLTVNPTLSTGSKSKSKSKSKNSKTTPSSSINIRQLKISDSTSLSSSSSTSSSCSLSSSHIAARDEAHERILSDRLHDSIDQLASCNSAAQFSWKSFARPVSNQTIMTNKLKVTLPTINHHHSNNHNNNNTSNISIKPIRSLSTTTIPLTNSSTQNLNNNKNQNLNNNKNGQQQKDYKVEPKYSITNATQFKTMAGVQSLVTSPTRENIELIRQQLREKNAKHNDDQAITLSKDDESKMATICIRSAAKNAISAKMMCDFLDVLDELDNWPEGKGVIICGHNGFFCSGGDLVSVRELANYEDGNRMATLMQYNLARLQALPMITMAFIEGKAIGGGAEIASTTDLRVMTSSAKFGYVHVRVGICSAWGGGSRLVQLVGPSRAIELMSSGRLVGATEALSMGLVNRVLDDNCQTSGASLANGKSIEPLEAAKKYLCEHLIGAKSTILAIKALVNAARTLPLEKALVAECQILSSTWGKPPHIEALNKNVKHRGDDDDDTNNNKNNHT